MINHKKRILLVISFSFSIRYIIRSGLLDSIQQFATPVIILTWRQADLINELKAANIEVHVAEPESISPAYENVRRKINYWFQYFKLSYGSKKIQEQYLNIYKRAAGRYRKKWLEWYNIARLYVPGYRNSLFKKEQELLHTAAAFQQVKKWVSTLQADAVFTLTPFHQQEDILLRACKESGLQMITSILSFDNLTKRGWIPVVYDVYMVWNAYNMEELYSIYPFTKSKAVHITGAPQFDFYNKNEWILPECEWREIVGIGGKSNRKIILFAGGPKELFPQEPLYLQHINEAISKGEIVGNPMVLFRCHPVDDIDRWKEAIVPSENVVFDTSWSGKETLYLANITNIDIKKLTSTLAYTDVHVNVCSTMTLDGSMFNKPQIGPAYLENIHKSKLLKRMYHQKHFEPIVEGDGIALADSKEMLIRKINDALISPEQFTTNQKKVLEQMITYTDGNSTARVAAIIKHALNPTVNKSHQAELCQPTLSGYGEPCAFWRL